MAATPIKPAATVALVLQLGPLRLRGPITYPLLRCPEHQICGAMKHLFILPSTKPLLELYDTQSQQVPLQHNATAQ